MLIGELSNKTGLSRDTIRFYEKQGLIAVGKKERRFNNYKEYSEETLKRLNTIKLIKSFGFTLNETLELLDMIDINTASCDNLEDKIELKVKLLDDKVKELINVRTLLLNGLKSCKTGNCSIKSTDKNCQIITTGKA